MKKAFSLFFCLLLCFAPVSVYAAEEDLTIYSDYYYMIDMDNGQIIFDHGSEELIYPASMTKMMTLIVGLENIKDTSERIVLNDEIFAGLYEANASMAGFSLNESVTLEDCLYGLFLPSGAEATRAIAFYVAGSEEAFVDLMNAKAKELNMENTHFVNTTGLHDNDHYTTLRDLAVLLEYCLQNEQFRKIFTAHSYTAKSGSYHSGGIFWQSSTFKNLALAGYKELDESAIIGGKTGYTIPAGLCLASVAELNGRRYMLITAHAPAGSTPYPAMDAVEIYSEVFNQYQKIELLTPQDVLGESPLHFNFSHRTVEFFSSEAIELTLPKEIQPEEIETILSVAESYDAPIEEGELLGTAALVYQGQTLYTFELRAAESIQRNPLLYGFYCLKEWMLGHLLWTGLILFVLGFLLWRLFVYRREIHRSLTKKRRYRRYR